MNFLEMVKYLMDQGWDEDTACRAAYAELYPENYNPADYEREV